MEVEIKQQFEIGFWFFNFCWYILNTYFNILFTYFIFWFLKQTAILFYFTNTNFVFCVHLSLLSPSLSLSLFITYVCTLVSQFSFNTHFPADFGDFPFFTLPAKISATSIHSVCGKYMSVFLSVCVCVCLCVCTYIYIYTYTYLYIHTYICNLLDLDLDLDLYRLLSYVSFSNRTTPLTCKLSVSICIIVALFHCFSFSILNTRIV